jgi:DNA-binding helix-hairpin-helix protein with protein kinase domain
METQPTEKTFTYQYARKPLQLDREIGAGGEGQVYSVIGSPSLAAKLYHHPNKQHMIKLSMMLMNPPPVPQTGQSTVIWPIDGIMDDDDHYAGFLMPMIDRQQNATLAQIYHPESRHDTAPNFTWKSLLSIAANIAALLDALHTANYVVGDLNESNILINIQTGTVHLIDCDSIQVPAPDATTFRCLVGKSEYTPPELQNVPFDRLDRLPAHDDFALAVLIFLLLMEGVHPFTGSRPHATHIPLPGDNIRHRQWPYAPDSELRPPNHALSLNILPSGLQLLMQRCFLQDNQTHQQRPTANEWLIALKNAQTQITRCQKNKRHWYSEHLHDCPWCKRQQQLHFDSFTPTPATSTPARKKTARRPGRRATRKTRVTQTQPRNRVAYFIISAIIAVSIGVFINLQLPGSFTNPSIINSNLTCPAGENGVPPDCQPLSIPTIPAITITPPPIIITPILIPTVQPVIHPIPDTR